MMMIESHWEQVEFHDARVECVRDENQGITFELLSVVVLDRHPLNKARRNIVLPRCLLHFRNVKSTIVRSYQSSTDTWTNCEKPYPYMKEIAEAKIAPNKWGITGFDTAGIWVEWQIEEFNSVQLEPPRDGELDSPARPAQP